MQPPYSRRQISLIFLSILLTIVGLTATWEFVVEDSLLGWLVPSHPPPPLSERIEYIVLSALFPLIALVVPWRLILRTSSEQQRLDKALADLTASIEDQVTVRTSELLSSKKFLQSVIDGISDPVLVVGLDYRIAARNKAAWQQLSKACPAEHPKRDYCYSLAHHCTAPCDEHDYPCTLKEVLRTGESCVLEHIHFDGDGDGHHVEVMGTPLHSESGDIIGIVEVTHDITKRQRDADELRAARDAAEQAAAAKTRFLASMSHEFRTPLNSIGGARQLLQRTELTPVQEHYVDIIRTAESGLLALIDSILDVARMEFGKLELVEEAFDLREHVFDVLDMLAYEAHGKGLELVGRFDDDVPSNVLGDGPRLQQILLNLLGNAVKYTSDGSVFLRIERLRDQGTTTWLRFTIRDTGAGIPEALLSRLFEPFVQGDLKKNGNQRGSGLGLAIAKSLVELMGGRIELTSDLDHGTTCQFELPLTRQLEGLRTRPTVPPGMRALVYEELDLTRDSLVDTLNSWGLKAEGGSNPDEVFKRLVRATEQGRAFDVAILRHRSTDPEGLSLARRVHADGRLAKATRVIMMTPLEDPLPAATLDAIGADGQIAKPIHGTTLRALLAGAAAGSPAHAAAPEQSPGTAAVASLRVLIAEDNALNREVAELLLKDIGINADTVSDGGKALEQLDRKPYDVVLMDCEMPETDGYTATRLIRERERERAGRPRVEIIGVTAHASARDYQRCIDAGMDQCLFKPLSARQLTEALVRIATDPATPPVAGAQHASRASRTIPLLNERTWQEMREFQVTHEQYIGQLTELFLDDTAARIESLRNQLTGKDLVSLARQAHSIRGGCKQVGAQRMERLAAQLESTALAGESALLGQLVDDLEESFEQTRIAMIRMSDTVDA